MVTGTRVTDPDTAFALLPAWFAGPMMAVRGPYGFLLATGDVVPASGAGNHRARRDHQDIDQAAPVKL